MLQMVNQFSWVKIHLFNPDVFYSLAKWRYSTRWFLRLFLIYHYLNQFNFALRKFPNTFNTKCYPPYPPWKYPGLLDMYLCKRKLIVTSWFSGVMIFIEKISLSPVCVSLMLWVWGLHLWSYTLPFPVLFWDPKDFVRNQV